MTTTASEPVLDCKTMITPHAFKIAPEIMYTPLATPLKRGIAILIDGLLISVLAEHAGWIFILLVGITLFIEHRSHHFGRWFKWCLYLLMLVIVIWGTSVKLTSEIKPVDKPTKLINKVVLVSLMPAMIRFERCENLDCAQQEITHIDAAMSKHKLSERERLAVLVSLIDDASFSEEDRAKLAASVKVTLEPSAQLLHDIEMLSAEKEALTEKVAELKSELNQAPDEIPASEKTPDEFNADKFSVLGWVKGVLNDLGLGFGWSAFYFTVFVAWFDGQTLGKKMMQIRVIQLDGGKITLWGAFGRYGGYAAGFTTGLLGFFQIYWDSNRQAIQDKISATVVIDLAKLAKKGRHHSEVNATHNQNNLE